MDAKTKTYKTSVSVPAHKEFKLQCRVRTEKIENSSKIQFQLLYTGGETQRLCIAMALVNEA